MSIRECSGLSEERLSILAMQREVNNFVSISRVILVGTERHYLRSFSPEGAAVEEVSLKEMVT